MAFSRGFNPGDSGVTEVADTKQADKEREIAAHVRAAGGTHLSGRHGLVHRGRQALARLRSRDQRSRPTP